MKSTSGVKSGAFTQNISSEKDFGRVLQANNIYNRSDIKWYDRYNRFGVLDPYNAVTNTKEHLFFTKPDLHICEPGTMNLNPELKSYSFFVDLLNRYPDVVKQLQSSIYSSKTSEKNVFMTVLSNSVKNTLDLPNIQASTIETATNIYGTSIDYRGEGYTSDEKASFSLEFEDSKYLELYHLFKAYEEYERLKHMGIITPPNVDNVKLSKSGYAYSKYIRDRNLHDQFSIFKFILDEDYETIMYYAHLCGVFIETVPRDSFSDIKTEGGLTYSVSFKANFVEDMNPAILYDFNRIISDNMVVPDTELPIYDSKNDSVDGRWAKVPYISKKLKSDYGAGVWLGPSGMKYDYKLKWRL